MKTGGDLWGVTGPIGAGKSAVLRMLCAAGAEVREADRVVHELYCQDHDLRFRIAQAFGPEVLDAAGQVDRRALGARVFGDPGARAQLDELVYPAVRARLLQLADVPADQWRVLEIPLLPRWPAMVERMREVVVVLASPQVRLQRVRARDGISEEEARSRLDAALSEDLHRSIGTRVVHNDGELADLEAAVGDLLLWRLSARVPPGNGSPSSIT